MKTHILIIIVLLFTNIAILNSQNIDKKNNNLPGSKTTIEEAIKQSMIIPISETQEIKYKEPIVAKCIAVEDAVEPGQFVVEACYYYQKFNVVEIIYGKISEIFEGDYTTYIPNNEDKLEINSSHILILQENKLDKKYHLIKALYDTEKNRHKIKLSIEKISQNTRNLISKDTSITFLTKMTYSKDSLENFKGVIKYYKYINFPKLKYSKPDIKKWHNSLEQINKPTENIKYIAVAYKNNQPKYIRLIIEPSIFTKEIYSIFNDTIKLEVTGLVVSAPNYSLFIYKKHLLNETVLYMAYSSIERKNLKIIFSPYRKEKYEYFKGTNKIKYIYTIFINKLAESETNFKTEYNKAGKQIKKTVLK